MSETILFASDWSDTRVTRSIFKGVDRVDIRQFIDIKGERRPTKKGVSIPMDHVPDLIAVLQALSAGGEA